MVWLFIAHFLIFYLKFYFPKFIDDLLTLFAYDVICVVLMRTNAASDH